MVGVVDGSNSNGGNSSSSGDGMGSIHNITFKTE